MERFLRMCWQTTSPIPTAAAILLIACAPTALADASLCRRHADAGPALTRLETTMAGGRFIAYQPTSLQIIEGRPTDASEASITADLKVLQPRFDGLITYSSINGAERIPDVAAKLGFKAVVIGVWDISSAQEINNAIAAYKRQPQLVVGISIGNEAVFGKRSTFRQLAELSDKIRSRAPGIPLTTTEPFHLFYERTAAVVLSKMDFMLVNVHPIFQPWFQTAPDANAADFVVNVVDKLAGIYCGPILVKETGVPTGPVAAGYTVERQASFYRELRKRFISARNRAFAYFSAFDAPWRVADKHPVPGFHPEEAHFGLYDEQRLPKPVVNTVPVLR